MSSRTRPCDEDIWIYNAGLGVPRADVFAFVFAIFDWPTQAIHAMLAKNVSLAVKSGALIPALLMLPNVVWMLFYNFNVDPLASVPLALSIAENVGRAAVLVLPFFYSLNVKNKYSTLALLGMAIALTVYYSAWGRFFLGGGSAELLSVPLFGIPGPLALAPVALLILSSYLIDSWLMLSASVYFGALHVWVSAVTG